jgi:4-hydroxy-tetrahydrodipicolinate synthase
VRMYRIVKQALAGTDACVIAGTGSNNTDESIALTKAAEEVGLDGALVVVPYYNKPSQEGMYLHFKAVAESTKLPIVLYNVPGRTSSNLLPATVKRLSDNVSNIVAVKEASSDMQQCAFIGAMTRPSFEIYSGDDFVNLPLLALGGTGAISVASHVIGSDIHRMHDLFFAGDIDGALKLHWKSLPLTKALFCTSNPVPVK